MSSTREPDAPAASTEARNPRTAALDLLEGEDLARALHGENHLVAPAIDPELPAIGRAIELIASHLDQGGRLLYVGAGTSGRIGVLDASECPPTFGVDPDTVQAIIAGGEAAIRFSVEGAEDDRNAGARAVWDQAVGPLDVVVGIAASGRTPYVLGALEAARQAGAATIAVVNVRPSEMERAADLAIAAVTGAEPVAGSTRMKAGTAQKMVLNLLSTGAMARIGRIYGNLMVDVRPTNAKLRDRAARIVMEAAGATREAAERALEEADWEVKTAIVMAARRVDAGEARRLLASSRGRLRPVLEAAA